jgi:hypothetical protein
VIEALFIIGLVSWAVLVDLSPLVAAAVLAIGVVLFVIVYWRLNTYSDRGHL